MKEVMTDYDLERQNLADLGWEISKIEDEIDSLIYMHTYHSKVLTVDILEKLKERLRTARLNHPPGHAL